MAYTLINHRNNVIKCSKLELMDVLKQFLVNISYRIPRLKFKSSSNSILLEKWEQFRHARKTLGTFLYMKCHFYSLCLTCYREYAMSQIQRVSYGANCAIINNKWIWPGKISRLSRNSRQAENAMERCTVRKDAVYIL